MANRPVQMPNPVSPALAAAIAETPSAGDIQKRLDDVSPPADGAAAKASAEKARLEEKRASMMTKEYTFAFSYKDGHDKVWEASFKNTVASVRTQRAIGAHRVELNLNLPVATLDGVTSELNLILAHLACTLDVSANPEGHWSRDLEGLYDNNLLYRLYEEVIEHEATFLGRNAPKVVG